MPSLEDGHSLQARGVPHTHEWLLANLTSSNKVLVGMKSQAGEKKISYLIEYVEGAPPNANMSRSNEITLDLYNIWKK